MSHVIPLWLVQMLNLHCWNCNVFGACRKMTALNYVRNLSGPGLSPSGAAVRPAGDTTPICPARPLACLQSLSKRLHHGCPKMSHVIPLRLVQVLNSCRWNCNVFGACRKMTALNYVRNLAGGGVVAAHGRRSLAPPPPTGTAARRCWCSGHLSRTDPPRTSTCLSSITFEVATSWLPKNVARNSPAISSSFEFMSLELQRFWGVSKNDRVKLRAKFGWRWCRCRPRAPWPGPAASHRCRGLARVFRVRPRLPALPALLGSATSLVGVLRH